MKAVNWADYMPNCTVVFSTLAVPDDRADMDDEVAGIILSNDFKVNITWNPKAHLYVLRLYLGSMRKVPIMEMEYNNPSELISAVVAWSMFADSESYSPIFSAPSRTPSNRITLIGQGAFDEDLEPAVV